MSDEKKSHPPALDKALRDYNLCDATARAGERGRRVAAQEIDKQLGKPKRNWRAAVKRVMTLARADWTCGLADCCLEMDHQNPARSRVRATVKLYYHGRRAGGSLYLSSDYADRAELLREIRALVEVQAQ